MGKIIQLRFYKKDLKEFQQRRQSKDINKLNNIISMLQCNQIERIANSHSIADPKLPDCRECHINFDLLLIYKYDVKGNLLLVRLGSHDLLYKKSWKNRHMWLLKN